MTFESKTPQQTALAPADRDTPTQNMGGQSARVSLIGRLTAGGTDGNERLTATTGLVLLILLAALGVTILRIRPLLNVHMFLGVLLIGPVILKLMGTGYRFMRYYTSEARYRRKGPPVLALRLIAPMVVLSTVVVFASGVALMFIGPSSRGTLLPIHKISFFVWLAFTTVHVLGHLPAMPAVLRADYGPSAQLSGDVTGRAGRVVTLLGALVAGVVLAIVSISQFAPWTHTHFPHH